jgi:predicted DNA-binding protein (MmcQ/YjbR family)
MRISKDACLAASKLALPEAVEYIDEFGHNTFKINGKSFVISGESNKGFSLSFKSDRETLGLLLQKEHFFQNPIYRTNRLGIVINPDGEDWDELIDLIQEAYLRAARSGWLRIGWRCIISEERRMSCLSFFAFSAYRI